MADHGTYARYNTGCREECCRAAARNYHKRRVHERRAGKPREIDSTGVRRRLQGLMWMGYSSWDIGAQLGISRARVQKLRTIEGPIRRSTLERIDVVYRELGSKPGPTDHMGNWLRSKARNLGYASPFAWDDDTIDDPDAKPAGMYARYADDSIDEQAIYRRMHGDKSVRLHSGETAELTRRAFAAGWTVSQLEAIGINASRYQKGAA